jgi:hypothetical protein
MQTRRLRTGSGEGQGVRHGEAGMIACRAERPKASRVQVGNVQLVKRERCRGRGTDFAVLEFNQILAKRIEECPFSF